MLFYALMVNFAILRESLMYLQGTAQNELTPDLNVSTAKSLLFFHPNLSDQIKLHPPKIIECKPHTALVTISMSRAQCRDQIYKAAMARNIAPMTPAMEPETALAALPVTVTRVEVADADDLTVAVPVLRVLLAFPVGTGPDPAVAELPFPPAPAP